MDAIMQYINTWFEYVLSNASQIYIGDSGLTLSYFADPYTNIVYTFLASLFPAMNLGNVVIRLPYRKSFKAFSFAISILCIILQFISLPRIIAIGVLFLSYALAVAIAWQIVRSLFFIEIFLIRLFFDDYSALVHLAFWLLSLFACVCTGMTCISCAVKLYSFIA